MATDRDHNKQRDIMVGLTIFARHGGTNVCAEHDQVFAGQGDDEALSDEEIATLLDHGWFHDPCSGCVDEDSSPADIGPVNPEHEDEPHLRTCAEWAIFV